uniref:Kinesin motor domain-containing protein n=1 Tax=Romanomermis culicivorax TaxID=13658 RepID=A0A915L4D1_ROMCU
MDIRNIKIDTCVDIKRSDGRIHGAKVSAVNEISRTVTVEWFEKGETKGKEIDLDQLIGLNPNLIPSVVGLDAEDDETPPPPLPASTVIVDIDDKDRKKRRQTSNLTTISSNYASTSRNGKIPVPAAKDLVKMRPVAEESEIAIAEADDPSPVHINPNATAYYVTDRKASLAASKRKSHTVQEIEKLKKNRDERRAKQEEMRQQKHDLQSVEPGNPNWEFSQMIRDFRDKLEYQRLKISDNIEDHQICVCVRKRPLSSKDADKKEIDVITVPNRDRIIVHQPQTKVDLTKYLENQTFRFDYAFDENSTNEMVYKFSAQPLVKTIFEQGFATCFAYGQTGSGKTHTMGGDFNGKSQQVAKGIYAMTARDVFKLRDKQYRHANLQVSCSFFEIYSGKVFDLLNNKSKLRVLEDGKQQVQICGLQESVVKNENEVLELIQRGSEVRTAGQTSANSRSSRSHAIFQIILRKM